MTEVEKQNQIEETKKLQAKKLQLSQEVKEIIEKFKGRNKAMVSMYFGINSKPHTLREVAREFSITEERVRQLVAKAIRYARPSKEKEQNF